MSVRRRETAIRTAYAPTDAASANATVRDEKSRAYV